MKEKIIKFKNEHDNLVAILSYTFAAGATIAAYAIMANSLEVVNANHLVRDDGREFIVVKQKNGKTTSLGKIQKSEEV